MIVIEKLHSRKVIYGVMGVGIAIIIALCLFMSWNEMRVKEIDISDATLISATGDKALTNLEYGYYLDNGKKGQTVSIRGWIDIIGRMTNSVSYWVILKDMSTGVMYQLPTAIESRPDVTEYINDGLNHDNSGFLCTVSNNGFDFTNKDYQIMIWYKTGEEEYLVDFGCSVVPKGE